MPLTLMMVIINIEKMPSNCAAEILYSSAIKNKWQVNKV
jgi:hypothetical protein